MAPGPTPSWADDRPNQVESRASGSFARRCAFLQYTVHRTHGDADGPLLVIQEFTSIEGFKQHSATMADQIPRRSAP